MNIQVEGLDGLRKRLGVGSRTLDAELRPALRASGEAIKAEARALAVGNKLPNSVQMRSLDGGLTQIVGSVAKTALSIEKGRQPGEGVSVGLITGWMRRKGIAARVEGARVSVATRQVLGVGRSRKGRSIGRAQRDLAWRIALAVRARGTKALPFIIPAGEHKKGAVQQYIRQGVARALARIAR